MRRFIIALAIILAQSAVNVAPAQSHRHTPRTSVELAEKQKAGADKAAEATASKSGKTATTATNDDNEGIEAYSDTTDTYLPDSTSHNSYSVNIGYDDFNDMPRMMEWTSGLMTPVIIIMILFVLAPVAILALLFFFIYKSRKQKLKLAEMAIQSGQPMPEDLLRSAAASSEDMWNKGIKNIFLGIGLVAFFYFLGIGIGKGIGSLVFFYGVGQAVIARTSASKRERDETLNDSDDKH